MKAAPVILALFFSSVTAAWAWFHVGVRPPDSYLVLHAKAEIHGYTFTPEPIGTQAIEILATTNLLNGTFTGPDGQRFRVFKADWKATDSRQLDVVSHTPDICWAGAGWVSFDAGQPPLVDIDLPGGRMTFECRAFRAPGAAESEVVIWSTLVNGQVMEEGARFRNLTDPTEHPRERMATAARRRGANLLVRSIRDRIPASGDKQFIRFSAPLQSESHAILERLKDFAAAWLAVHDLKHDHTLVHRS